MRMPPRSFLRIPGSIFSRRRCCHRRIRYGVVFDVRNCTRQGTPLCPSQLQFLVRLPLWPRSDGGVREDQSRMSRCAQLRSRWKRLLTGHFPVIHASFTGPQGSAHNSGDRTCQDNHCFANGGVHESTQKKKLVFHRQGALRQCPYRDQQLTDCEAPNRPRHFVHC